MGPTVAGQSLRFRVFIDGQPPGIAHRNFRIRVDDSNAPPSVSVSTLLAPGGSAGVAESPSTKCTKDPDGLCVWQDAGP